MNESARNTEFISTLTDIRAGELCHELTEEMIALVRAVLVTGKKGKMKVEFAIRPEGIGKVCITDTVAISTPKADTGKTMMFATEAGQLLAQDPRQMTLPMNIMTMVERPLVEVPVAGRSFGPELAAHAAGH